jgi:hypothetical protein
MRLVIFFLIAACSRMFSVWSLLFPPESDEKKFFSYLPLILPAFVERKSVDGGLVDLMKGLYAITNSTAGRTC